MYHLFNEPNITNIFGPDKISTAPIAVHEIGHSYPIIGYESWKRSRNVFVIHYVLHGEGTYFGNPVKGPCAFLMCPGESHYYTVSSDPLVPRWEQYWIMFSGECAETFLNEIGLTPTPHIFPCPYIRKVWQIMQELQTPENYWNQDDRYIMLSGLFRLFSEHAASFHSASRQSHSYSHYVQKALLYIHENYASDICEDSIANAIHLSTRYTHRIFKMEMGMSPMHYVNHYRIQCAKKLLSDHLLPINQVAEAVGFSNPNYFSYVFQKFNNGISPLKYKKSFFGGEENT